MAVGLSATFAAAQLNVLRGVAASAVTPYVKLHTGDPGAAGTANASAVTTRNAVTFGAPVAGVMSMTALSPWSMTATETITHVSLWDAATGGNFLASGALSAGKAVVATDTLTLTSLTITKSNIAA